MMQKYILCFLGFLCFLATAEAQNVGIGESSPQQKLHIDGSDAGLQTIRIEDLATGQDGDFGQTSGANIQTTTTTDRAVYVDGNGDMTARYMYGDNTQSVVGSAGSQTINSSTFVDINQMSITFTPRHSVVYINFVVSGYVNLPVTGDASEWFVVQIEQDGAYAGYRSLALVSELDDLGGSSSAGSVTCTMFPLSVTPGVSTTINLAAVNGGADEQGFTIDRTNYTTYMTIWD